MSMYQILETQSNRVKGLAFHLHRPWLLASLHNGVLQLWDYRMKTIIDTFDDHNGPVRCIDFHPTQPLFVSGGDDNKIKVWNFNTRACLFTLKGHLDYVRTVEFHHTYPWILSASDDQTLRIWNWQSRQCISVLTGHNHYVMSGKWHPKEDLIISASLDNSVRVWDVSGLRKKLVSIAGSSDQTAGRSRMLDADLWGGSDVVVSAVFEGHSRGVNWAAFHPDPNKRLVLSCADDREVKVWMNAPEGKVYEVETFRGHTNNVSCVMFHPSRELVISNSEDRTLRIWDMSHKDSPHIWRLDNSRFWILACHPVLNLFAAGHDHGLSIFKLERERIPMDIQGKVVYYFYQQLVRCYDFNTGKDTPLFATRRETSSQPKSLFYNRASSGEHHVLLFYANDGKKEVKYSVYLVDGNSSEVRLPKMSSCDSIAFVARNRFAILQTDGFEKHLLLKNMRDETKKRDDLVGLQDVQYLFPAGVGRILLKTSSSLILYDVNTKEQLGTLDFNSRSQVKHVFWSPNKSYFAATSKKAMHIIDENLVELACVREKVKIKSVIWDRNIAIYATTTHIKYSLLNGDTGVIRAIEAPVYLIGVFHDLLYYFSRQGEIKKFELACEEYHFKQALLNKDWIKVVKLIRSDKLVGMTIINWLKENNFSQVALRLVQDPNAKFALALECGDIECALECAKQLNQNDIWHKLGVEALRQGNHQIVEMAYQRTHNFERLSFLYLITGDTEKLSKMLQIAELRKDMTGCFHNAIFLGDASQKVKILRATGNNKLAYTLAKSHSLDELADSIAEDLGTDVPQLPRLSKPFELPKPIMKGLNWPLVETGSQSAFTDDATIELERAESLLDAHPDEYTHGAIQQEASADIWGDSDIKDEEDVAPPVQIESFNAWGDGFDLTEEVDQAPVEDDSLDLIPTAHPSFDQNWALKSPADYIASGKFEEAMLMLNRNLGIVNFEEMRSLFFRLYYSCRAHLPTSGILLSLPIHRSKNLPYNPILQSECNKIFEKAITSFSRTDLSGALDNFRRILLLLPISDLSDSDDANKLLQDCKEYINASRLELSRREVANDNHIRQFELAALFAQRDLQPSHQFVSHFIAAKSSFDVSPKLCEDYCLLGSVIYDGLDEVYKKSVAGLYRQIRVFAKRCKDNQSHEPKVQDWDTRSRIPYCCGSLRRLSRGAASIFCPYCKSEFGSDFKGKLCNTCNLAVVGNSVTDVESIITRERLYPNI